ncbi:MAG: hypothetical protein ACTHK0_00945 [Ginsengibacter sp.]
MKKLTANRILQGLLFFMLTYQPALAQIESSNNPYRFAKVYISVETPQNGVAFEDKSITINSEKGSYAYIVINTNSNNLRTKSLTLKAYKKIAGNYEKIGQENYSVNTEYSYTHIKYPFYTTGDFAFDVFDGDNIFIGTGKVSVASKGSTEYTSTSTGSSNTLSKYANSKVFCSIEVPVYGIAKESSTLIINKTNGSYAYIVIDNYPTNFNVSSIVLKSYRKVNGEWKRVDNKTYDIKSDSFYTYIKYPFYDAGDYVFDVYDVNNNFINSGYVTVTFDR